MKNFKKYISITLLLMLLLTGCAKLVNVETQKAEVIIVDKYYKTAWMQPMRSGKVTTFIHHPAVYRITVYYDDVKYDVSGSETYNQFKDKIGQTATGVFEISNYDDGSSVRKIVGLEE